MRQSTMFPLCILAVFFFSITGCHRYYKVNSTSGGIRAADTISTLNKNARYFVLRTPSRAFYMFDNTLNAERNKLTFRVDSLPPEHTVYAYGRKKNNKYTDASVLTEVHLYTSLDTFIHNLTYTLPLEAIQKIEVLEKDKGRTTTSYILGSLGYTAGIFGVVAVVAIATKSSCPFISAFDGKQFTLQGETFGGAIYPQLVRHDYLPLKMAAAENGNLQLKISNELQEKQYTDVAELMVIKHSKDQLIVPDQEGNLYTIQKPLLPDHAVLGDDRDVTSIVSKKDNQLLYFDDSSHGHSVNKLTMHFTRRARDKKGKLILKLKNSYWLDFLYGEVAKGLGSYYPKYASQQMKKPAGEIIEWTRQQNIPLEVSIKTKGAWQKIYDLTTVGPVALRDVIIPIDCSDVTEENLEVRLSSGYKFWEIDYAAMDFTENKIQGIEILKPYIARDEAGKDVLASLTKEDDNYLEQPVPGTVASIEYKWKPLIEKDTEYSFILHSRGYYMHVRNYKGFPDKKFLSRFKKPGAFADFSVERFKQFDRKEVPSWVSNN